LLIIPLAPVKLPITTKPIVAALASNFKSSVLKSFSLLAVVAVV
jgi:hypothetical protein